ncbi:hypothetical protein LSH36_606g01050 [Paralvinella palmiformis]|uniref:PDZ domain-containing protein n=1 Tax=Paralvinella palmiformis TaxID=53620 RepID=A0AAD9J5I6_9ANNE|nr:hypothetical protein LSH36_606g01050 [Paralvinella palmiformis]
MTRSGSTTQNDHVFVGHPVYRDKCLDFGMKLSSDKRHVIEWIDKDGLACECGVSVGDEILTVNNMPITRWASDVLLKLLSIINVTNFELTLSPSDDVLKKKGLIRHITINLMLDKNSE